MSKSRFISAPESMKVHSFDPGAWSRHMITRARQEESVGLFKVVHGVCSTSFKVPEEEKPGVFEFVS